MGQIRASGGKVAQTRPPVKGFRATRQSVRSSFKASAARARAGSSVQASERGVNRSFLPRVIHSITPSLHQSTPLRCRNRARSRREACCWALRWRIPPAASRAKCAGFAAGGRWFRSGGEGNGLKVPAGAFSLVIGPPSGLTRLFGQRVRSRTLTAFQYSEFPARRAATKEFWGPRTCSKNGMCCFRISAGRLE
jgi:hypothetical protein